MKTYITQGFYGFGLSESACAGISAAIYVASNMMPVRGGDL